MLRINKEKSEVSVSRDELHHSTALMKSPSSSYFTQLHNLIKTASKYGHTHTCATLICASKHNCVDAYTHIHTSNIETYGLERGMKEREEAWRRGTEWWADLWGKHIWTYHANTTTNPAPLWYVYPACMMLQHCESHHNTINIAAFPWAKQGNTFWLQCHH